VHRSLHFFYINCVDTIERKFSKAVFQPFKSYYSDSKNSVELYNKKQYEQKQLLEKLNL